jgi:PIN domain nuclease of toxin-antitoxin system
LDALKKQQLRGSKRPRLAGSRATGEAAGAAQRRQQDPAAVHVQLVRGMQYLKLKRAALLALLQSEQQGQQAEQQLEELDRAVQKLNLAEVTAQLLDARWTTEQLSLAHATAKGAAQDISQSKKCSKAAKKQQQQQQQQGQQHLWPESEQPRQDVGDNQAAAPMPVTSAHSAGRLKRQCNLVPKNCRESSSSSGSSSSGSEGNDST